MEKSTGITPAEQYLNYLGKKSFLSLWSNSNVFYDKGKELTDLLVVCGNHIIIFQDKWSAFPNTSSLEEDWKKWFRRTVIAGSKQVWGAERTIRSGSKLYVDPACNTELPIPLPKMEDAIFHLIVVTHGGSKACKEILGGSGSFMLNNDVKTLTDHTQPFVVGDLDTKRTYVHILDDASLSILMNTLDTITDFTLYLNKKEKLLRSSLLVFSSGEEELLANYLKNINQSGEHDFDFGITDKKPVNGVGIAEGGWLAFTENPQRLAQLEQDKISYLWDDLIEEFSKHSINGTQYVNPQLNYVKGINNTEKILRFMAREPRFARRILSSSIKEILEITPETQRRIRILASNIHKDTYYVLLLFPLPKSPSYTYDDYRGMRSIFMEGTAMVTKLTHPDAKNIIGFATESGLHNDGRSEDAIYLDASNWTEEMERSAKKFQDDFGILTNPTEQRSNTTEYPDVVSKEEFLKNPRNKPCPCGSGKKYKKCCELKGRKFYQ